MSDDKDKQKSKDDAEKKKADPEGKEDPDEKEEEEETTKLGRFIQKYHTFLSSFVIGVAGLIATSIWQYRQSEVARRQAESQQRVAETNAENQWRIEKAEILSKNLQVLSAQTGNVEQRYGVLLSLARGNILDPELAVSYALELGKENPDYMQSVLANTASKDYQRLSRAFVMSCEQRYGIARNVPVCSTDRLSRRSDAIAQLIADETQAAMSQNQPGPLVMLKDERDVQQNVQRLSALFWAGLTDLYERRMWNEVNRFANYSQGAHIVSALVLAAARTGEFVSADEAKKLDAFHDQQAQWLSKYLMSTACDAECKGKIVEVMISHYDESLGDYDAALRKLVESPRAQSGNAISRLHARLLWCQVHEVDLQPLRDNVLVPAIKEMLEKPKPDPTTLDDLVGLLALAPEPAATEKPAVDAYRALVAQLEKANARYGRVFRDRRSTASRERLDPPPAMKKVSFCGVPETAPTVPE